MTLHISRNCELMPNHLSGELPSNVKFIKGVISADGVPLIFMQSGAGGGTLSLSFPNEESIDGRDMVDFSPLLASGMAQGFDVFRKPDGRLRLAIASYRRELKKSFLYYFEDVPNSSKKADWEIFVKEGGVPPVFIEIGEMNIKRLSVGVCDIPYPPIALTYEGPGGIQLSCLINTDKREKRWLYQLPERPEGSDPHAAVLDLISAVVHDHENNEIPGYYILCPGVDSEPRLAFFNSPYSTPRCLNFPGGAA